MTFLRKITKFGVEDNAGPDLDPKDEAFWRVQQRLIDQLKDSVEIEAHQWRETRARMQQATSLFTQYQKHIWSYKGNMTQAVAEKTKEIETIVNPGDFTEHFRNNFLESVYDLRDQVKTSVEKLQKAGKASVRGENIKENLINARRQITEFNKIFGPNVYADPSFDGEWVLEATHHGGDRYSMSGPQKYLDSLTGQTGWKKERRDNANKRISTSKDGSR